MVGCHYFSPCLRLPSQPQSTTVPWLVPSYTAWWQRHILAHSCYAAFAPSRIWTHDLLIANPKCTLDASRADPRWVMVIMPTRQTDGRTDARPLHYSFHYGRDQRNKLHLTNVNHFVILSQSNFSVFILSLWLINGSKMQTVIIWQNHNQFIVS